jgi:predicted HD phosphohydrolase
LHNDLSGFTKEPDYPDGLSEASRKSLHLQGGPMDETETVAFETEPHFELAVRVGRCDDMGKVPDMRTPSLDDFVPLPGLSTSSEVSFRVTSPSTGAIR